ncbi:hypothetical protein Tco_1112811 [Tanacetum coccineum]|uniref:Uncharacterized protein n=1 Tax=Tanacetum coccineum TaxID=301880 RepID=A0ABQ5IT44_9ASTR
MLCKQGDWFSFAKRCVPSLVCIDDNRSCMRHWKSVFFFINRRAIPDSMVWRHPSVAIDDPRPAAGSFILRDADGNEDLVVGTPRSKILAKAGASQNLFMGDDDGSDDDDDDDAYVEIPLVNPLRSAGKGIMADDAAASSVIVNRPRPSSRPVPSFRDVSEDAIHTNFFPFSASPYYATYPEGGVARNCEFTREEWDAPYRPTFGVLTKKVFKDPTVCKTVIDQFPTPGEMVGIVRHVPIQRNAHVSPPFAKESTMNLLNVPTSRDARVSPPIAKESTMTSASKS